jgi:hypothetical protein
LSDARVKLKVFFNSLLEAAVADGQRGSLPIEQELIALPKHFVLVRTACWFRQDESRLVALHVNHPCACFVVGPIVFSVFRPAWYRL